MRFRKLRIAWSVFWGTLYLLLIAWWVRGYWWHDGGFVRIPPKYHIQCSADDGRMCLWLENRPLKFWFDIEEAYPPHHIPPGSDQRIPWFNVGFWPKMIRVYAAHWVFVVPAGAFAVLPWVPRRFSMRGLLIATTAVAIIAGAIAFVDKNFPAL